VGLLALGLTYQERAPAPPRADQEVAGSCFSSGRNGTLYRDLAWEERLREGSSAGNWARQSSDAWSLAMTQPRLRAF
jgi:hypothetical protein